MNIFFTLKDTIGLILITLVVCIGVMVASWQLLTGYYYRYFPKIIPYKDKFIIKTGDQRYVVSNKGTSTYIRNHYLDHIAYKFNTKEEAKIFIKNILHK